MKSHTGELSGCMGKKRFESFAIARQRANAKNGRRPRVAYRCDYCGGIHIGERDVDRERARRQMRREILEEFANADD